MTEPGDMGRRWDRAAQALAAYADAQPSGGPEEERVRDPEEVIAELLCDFHHLADGLGLSWTALAERAERYYAGEAPGHVVEITAEGFQVLDTRTETLRADVWSSRRQAQLACDELNGAADELAAAG